MANEVNSPRNAKFTTKQLLSDTTSNGAVSAKFDVLRGQVAVLRSTNLDGSAVIGLYYGDTSGNFTNPATDDNGTAVTLTPTNPERIINVIGSYKVQVDTVASTQGEVFIQS